MRIHLKVRKRGKRGYDISSIPYKKLKAMKDRPRLEWSYRELSENEGWLTLKA